MFFSCVHPVHLRLKKSKSDSIGRCAGGDACDFESADQGHSRVGDIDAHEISRPDLGADAAKLDGFGAGEDEIRTGDELSGPCEEDGEPLR